MVQLDSEDLPRRRDWVGVIFRTNTSMKNAIGIIPKGSIAIGMMVGYGPKGAAVRFRSCECCRMCARPYCSRVEIVAGRPAEISHVEDLSKVWSAFDAQFGDGWVSVSYFWFDSLRAILENIGNGGVFSRAKEFSHWKGVPPIQQRVDLCPSLRPYTSLPCWEWPLSSPSRVGTPESTRFTLRGLGKD